MESSSFNFTCFQLSGNLIMQVSFLGPIYTKRQRQRCDDACDSVLIENNRVAPEWGLQPIFKRLLCFQWEQNRKRHRSIDADPWCKRALMNLVETWM